MSKRFDKRLERVQKQVGVRPVAGLFDIIEVVPVSCGKGRPPGLYNAGGPGSTAGILLFDPALGRPKPPLERMAPHCITVVLDSYPPDFDPWA
jgi:hypothetical protein